MNSILVGSSVILFRGVIGALIINVVSGCSNPEQRLDASAVNGSPDKISPVYFKVLEADRQSTPALEASDPLETAHIARSSESLLLASATSLVANTDAASFQPSSAPALDNSQVTETIAPAPFVAPPPFSFSVGGISVTSGVGVDEGTSVIDGMSTASAVSALSGYYQQNAAIALHSLNKVNAYYFQPMQRYLELVQKDQSYSVASLAKDDADFAEMYLSEFRRHPGSNVDYYQGIGLYFAMSNNAAYAPLYKAFVIYGHTLETATTDAQSVPERINAYISSGIAPAHLLQAGQTLIGTPYGPEIDKVGHKTGHMTCDQFISHAAALAHLHIDTYPTGSNFDPTVRTVTQSWYKNGMGGDFEQIYPPLSGSKTVIVTLGDLAQALGDESLTIPPGSVIVTSGHGGDGHAALYVKVVRDDATGQWRIVTLDSNDSDDSTRLVNGKQQIFVGHQVGEHLTGSQWRPTDPIKVFEPKGNHQSDWQSYADCDLNDPTKTFFLKNPRCPDPDVDG